MIIREAATFQAPLSTVFDLIADGTQATRWVVGVQKSEQETPGPIGVGTIFRWVVQVGPVREGSVQEITLFDPQREIGFRSVGGNVSVHGHWLFSVENARTVVIYEATAGTEGSGLGRLLGGRLGRGLVASNVRISLDRLRRIVEHR